MPSYRRPSLKDLPDEKAASCYVLGIDEAGRGSVLGPLVVAGVFMKATELSTLDTLGVTDSKDYGSSAKAQEKRSCLAEKIRSIGKTFVVKVPSCCVDRWVKSGGLNNLEIRCARYIISKGPPLFWALADGENLFHPLTRIYSWFSAINHADQKEPLVSAASIIAKHERDLSMKGIFDSYKDTFGEPGGGGYVNKKTEIFLRSFYSSTKLLPAEVRLSWKWKVIEELTGNETAKQTVLFKEKSPSRKKKY